MKVFVLEDDHELARHLRAGLAEEGHMVDYSNRGDDALQRLRIAPYDVAVLDIGVPGMDGFTVVQHLRDQGFRIPVLFLTARDTVPDRVRGLRVGGDDYLVKPFAMEELIARCEALHRRSAITEGSAERKLGEWTLEPLLRKLTRGSDSVELQPREWALLDLLMANEGLVLSKSFLLEKVWDIQFDPGTNVVDAMVCRLRRKIDAPGIESYVQTVRGKGYVFKSHA
jgi:DNA-binding response OmpR family regulator